MTGCGPAPFQFPGPIGGLLRLTPVLVELNQPGYRGFLVGTICGGDTDLPFQHPVVSGDEEWFRLCKFALSGQTGSQLALGVESQPGVGPDLLVEG